MLNKLYRSVRRPHALVGKTAAPVAVLVLVSASLSLSGADITGYSVTKGILFRQNNANPPTIRSGLPYVFQAMVLPATNLITSARVQWSLADVPLAPISSPSAVAFIQRVRTQEALDATFPNGEFRIVTQTVNDGSHTATLSVGGNDYPPAPILLNFAGSQTIDASFPFTLQWTGFVGGTTSDYVYVQIENSQGKVLATSPHPGMPGALNGTATSVLIPSQTLQPGRSYVGRIVFYHYSSMNLTDYPGIIGVGGYFSQTDFTIATTGGGDTTPPVLLSSTPADGATDVPVNTPVVFQFNEQMSRGLAVGISGTTATRSFDWSPDSRTLVITPTTNWPPNANITWTLNLYYTQLAFGDTNANALPMETVVSFSTGSTTNLGTAASLSDAKRLPNGRFQFTVTGQNNYTYTVQGSPNLIQWTSLATNVAFSGKFDFLETNAPAIPSRFYRALSR
jgi:hypothetical protein